MREQGVVNKRPSGVVASVRLVLGFGRWSVEFTALADGGF